MAITRWTGPLHASGSNAGPGFSNGEGSSTPGPSAFAHGVALFDNRFGTFAGTDESTNIPAWYGAGFINVLDQAPSALSATNLAAAQVPVAGTAMTLAGASTGITVLAAPYAIISTQVFPTGALIIDNTPIFVTVQSINNGVAPAGGIACYDARRQISRAVQFTSVGDDHLGTVAIVGVDSYGFTIHETVTLSNATVANSKKCYKGIISFTPGGTLSGSNLSVGTADIFEFPLAVQRFPFTQIYWNSALISSSTGFTTADITSPATATTGDVRGTYATQSASDGTKLLQVFVCIPPRQMTQAGTFGVAQW